MRIAMVGKGGSGKTTVSALLIRHLSAGGRPVVAVDADINQHLGAALGLSDEQAAALSPMSAHLSTIKDYLRGDNQLIAGRRVHGEDHAARTGLPPAAGGGGERRTTACARRSWAAIGRPSV